MRKIFLKFIMLIMFLVNINMIFGLGIAPAKNKFDFNQFQQEGAFRVVVDDTPTKIIISKEGELAKYISLDKETMIIENKETWINYKIQLPNELPPGERSCSLIVLELPREMQNDVIMAAPAVMHKIIVNVPYPGKYAEGNLFITNTKVNEPIIFTFAIKNFGKEKIENAKINLVIKGPTNEELYKATSESKSIESNKEESFILTWQTEHSGSYVLEATLEYDSKILEFYQKFDVGNLEVEIEKIEINNFKIGQIAKLDIYLRNKWNKQIKAEGKVDVFKDNKLISTFNAIPVSINEKSTSIMNAYWNTEGLTIGEYELSTKVIYEDKISEKTYTAYVSPDSVNFKNYVSAKVIGQGNKFQLNILIIGVIILILLNIILIIFILKKRNN
ncbi:MAG: CARDB domain-containing protein [Candidatus Woesearchaeota archaeon]